MKRLVIVLFLVVGVIITGCYSLYRIHSISQEIFGDLDAIEAQLALGDKEAAANCIGSMEDNWDEHQNKLSHHVPHNQLETVTQSVAMLRALLEENDMAGLKSQLSSIRWQTDRIWKNSIPSWDNIL